MYVTPEPDVFYVGAADVGGGRGGDPSTIEIFDYYTLEQCAEFRADIEPDLLASVIQRLGLYYNTAFMAPEANAEGRTTIDRLAWQLHYPRLYHRERTDTASEKVNFERPGWYTSAATKIPAITNLAVHIRNRTVKIHSPRLLDELDTFIYDPTARGELRYRSTNEGSKGHGDLVMATAICLYVRDSWQCQPPPRRERAEKSPESRLIFTMDDEDDEQETSWLISG